MTNTGTSGILRCLHIQDGVANLNNNTIKNMNNASTSTASAMYGIYCTSAASNHVINKNTIQNLNLTTTSAVSINVFGIAVTAGVGKITKNYITGLTNQANAATADIAGIITTNSTWNIENNVIIIDNSTYINPITIKGIHDASIGTDSIYHNTVKISGSPAASAVKLLHASWKKPSTTWMRRSDG